MTRRAAVTDAGQAARRSRVLLAGGGPWAAYGLRATDGCLQKKLVVVVGTERETERGGLVGRQSCFSADGQTRAGAFWCGGCCGRCHANTVKVPWPR